MAVVWLLLLVGELQAGFPSPHTQLLCLVVSCSTTCLPMHIVAIGDYLVTITTVRWSNHTVCGVHV